MRELLERLETSLGPRSGEPIPLAGGITNRNLRVNFGGQDCVVRLPGKDTNLLGIDRTSERLACEQAAALGIGPPLLHADDECAVTEFVGAQPLDQERLRADPGPVARALRAFHDSGLELPTRFWVPDLLRQYTALLVRRRRAGAPPRLLRAQALVDRIAAVLPLSEPVPCHDDLLPGNLLAGPDRVLIVDWEYAGMGHRLFDLGNLAVNHDFDAAAEARLLHAYFGAPAPPGRCAALRLMKLVSDAREAAWGVVQAELSDLDFDFGDYAAQHFERLERAAAGPDLEAWLHAATA
jgi:thiamine kinase-like enzyme